MPKATDRLTLFNCHSVLIQQMPVLLFSLLLGSGVVQASNQVNLENGKKVYQKCQACHSLKRDRTGPRHCGLMGRKAGSLKGYQYSEAMRNSDIVWDEESLDAFLESPFRTIPGTVMGYGGVWDEQDRKDLIAYLVDINSSAYCGQRKKTQFLDK